MCLNVGRRQFIDYKNDDTLKTYADKQTDKRKNRLVLINAGWCLGRPTDRLTDRQRDRQAQTHTNTYASLPHTNGIDLD